MSGTGHGGTLRAVCPNPPPVPQHLTTPEPPAAATGSLTCRPRRRCSVTLTAPTTAPLADAHHYDALTALSQLLQAAAPTETMPVPVARSAHGSRLLLPTGGTPAVLDAIEAAPRQAQAPIAALGSADAA